ncbi:MAG: hypothetical protein WBB28_04465 [Crinalium sp.]
MKTTITADKALAIPFVDAGYRELNESGKVIKRGRTGEPEILRNSLLQKMFEPEELESLIIVKTDSKNPDPKDLKRREFDDGIERRIMFSSGGSNYFGDQELFSKVSALFKTEPDTACRYGSLLVSNCMEGSAEVENLRVKIVDYEDPKYAEFKTGDCHGKISPALAEEIGGSDNRATQFRFVWLESWDTKNAESNAPSESFLAKGTLLPDPELTDDKGYDLILDRSSIKGINKAKIKDLIPCGDYEFPKAILGNRENSEVGQAKNSWQLFGIWASEEAQRLDLVPETKRQAEKLASLQQDPLKLRDYLIEKYDKRKEFSRSTEEEELDPDTNDEDSDGKKQKQEMRFISLLRADEYGQMLQNPAMVEFLQNSVAKEWKELAINTGVRLTSGMVLPCPDIPEGTICAKHLPDGEDIVLTRYPVLNKDNIRKYTNDTGSYPELTKYEGIIWVNPNDFSKYHQGDFDGDKAVTIPASKIPNIAKELLRAGEDPEYISVVKAQKVPYTQAVDEDGKQLYGTLAKIAVASSQQSVGLVATYIGRVASAVPNEDEDLVEFKAEQKRLIVGLSIMEQYEVDYQKNSLRGKDAKEILRETGIEAGELLTVTKEFCEDHPSHLFDYKKDERLYKAFPMPADGANAINVVAREAVNPYWEASRLKERDRDEFTYLLQKKGEIEEVKDAEWAADLNQRFKKEVGAIKERTKDDKIAFKEAIGNLYEGYRAEVNELCGNDPERRIELATALMHVTHTSPNTSKHRQKCQEVAKELKVSFSVEPEYQLLHEALPREAYVLQVPFKKVPTEQEELVVDEKYRSSFDNSDIKYEHKKKEKVLIVSDPDSKRKVQKAFDQKGLNYDTQAVQGELPNAWKDKLDARGIKYEAIAHETLPLVEFAFKIPTSQKLPEETANYIEALKNKFGKNENLIDPNELTLTDPKTKKVNKLAVVAPTDCPWIESREQPGKSKLFYNLFADELCKVLAEYKVKEIGVIGVKHKNNDLTEEDFTDKKWKKPVTLTVGTINLPKEHKDYIKSHGAPILQIDGKNLGTINDNSPKLPVGTTFVATIKTTKNPTALTLEVDRESIKLPEITSKKEKKREQQVNPEAKSKSLTPIPNKTSNTVSKPSITEPTPKVTKVENSATKNWWEEADDLNAVIDNKKSGTVTHEEPTAKTPKTKEVATKNWWEEADDLNAVIDSKKSGTAKREKSTTQTPTNTSKSEKYGKLLIDKISTQMAKGDRDLTQEQKFTVCNWVATVRPSQICTVRDEGNDQVFKCNLRTKETLMPLSDYDASRFDEAVQLKRAGKLNQVSSSVKAQMEA